VKSEPLHACSVVPDLEELPQSFSFKSLNFFAMNWYNIRNIDTIDSPALLLYKERVQQNINR
jgi:hypothetical protein